MIAVFVTQGWSVLYSQRGNAIAFTIAPFTTYLRALSLYNNIMGAKAINIRGFLLLFLSHRFSAYFSNESHT